MQSADCLNCQHVQLADYPAGDFRAVKYATCGKTSLTPAHTNEPEPAFCQVSRLYDLPELCGPSARYFQPKEK